MDSDPEIEIIEKDSGMSSIGDSKDDTPERKEPVRVLMCGQWSVVKAVELGEGRHADFHCSVLPTLMDLVLKIIIIWIFQFRYH